VLGIEYIITIQVFLGVVVDQLKVRVCRIVIYCFCLSDIAGVCYAPNKPVKFEDINVAPPQATEVRIKMTNACICQSDLYFWKGKVNHHAL
jgi:hypothetical protein